MTNPYKSNRPSLMPFSGTLVYKYLLLSGLVLLLLPVSSQGQKSVDSYLSLEGQARFDSLEVRHVLTRETTDSVVAFAEIQAIKNYAAKTQNSLLSLFADYLKGDYYLSGKQKNRDNVYQYFENLDARLAKLPVTPLTEMFQANLQSELGIAAYYKRDQSDRAITHFLSADLIYRKIGYEKVLFATNKLANLGQYYYDRVNDYDRALQYLREAEKYISQDQIDVHRVLFCRTMAKCLLEKKQYAEAIRYNKLGIAQIHLKKDSVRIGALSGNIGEIILNHYPNPLEAEPYFQKELYYRLRYNPKGADDIAKVYGNLCLIEGLKYNREKVIDYYNKAIRELEVYKKEKTPYIINYALKVIYRNRMVADSLLGDYKSAFHHRGLYNQVTSDLNKQELKLKTTEASARFESEKFKLQADLANEQARNSRVWILFISLLLLVVIVGAYMIYNYQRLKRNKLAQQLAFELKEAERLSELDTLKTRFFTNVSHEFRTPLTLLVGPLADLRKKFPKEELLQLMERNLSRLQMLINQLLDLSKLEAGKMEPQIQQADLWYFLKNLLASFESLGDTKTIAFNYPKHLPPTVACFDADKTEKIVTNLVSNAFKFTPENGQINVGLNFTDTHFTITVQDTGIGIEAERLPHIFDRFYQVDNSNRRNYEGTGIGLALVKELVEVLKGEIKVESQIGKGSTFEVRIPCDKSSWEQYIINQPLVTKEPTPRLVNEPQQPAANKTTDTDLPILLIVEDNADLRAYISSYFEQTYQIIEAADGQEGYEKAIEAVPDLVICDLMMPRLDGFEFCKLIKSDIRTNHIPVIMLTAKATLEDRLEGLELGADDYLAKPFNTEELQIRIRNLINIRQVLREKYSQQIAEGIVATTTKGGSADNLFLLKLSDIIEKHLSESSFSVEVLADEMNMTSVQLRRKLKAITNQTAIEFIRNYRLEKAASMLQNKQTTVSEVAYLVGFESLSYFSKVFQEKFGKLASEWT